MSRLAASIDSFARAVVEMKGKWLFVLLCLSLAGKLVLGSIFPTINTGSSQPHPSENLDQVKWPQQTVAMTPEIVEEAKINTRDLHVVQVQEKKSDNDQVIASRNISPTTNINTEKKETNGQINEMGGIIEITELPSKN